MKIVIVITHLGGGGAERVGVSLANGLANRGHQVVIATDLNASGHYFPNDNVKVVHFVNKAKQSGVKWFLSIFTLRKVFKIEKPDVVIGIMQLCSFVSKLAGIGMNIPVVMTEHNSFERPASAPLSKIGYFSKFYLNKFFPLVTVLTQADKNIIGNKLNNVVVMPNPLALKPVKDMPLKEKIILAAGRLDDWHYKGFDVLIKAWEKIVKSEELIVNSERWKLQIAGTGSEKSLNYLKGLCKENRIEEYVEFLGFQKDIEKLYQKASIFVLSSRYEGFGLVLIEAMSQGCACIACDYKGRQKEILRSLTPNPSPKGEGELPTEGSGAAEPETRNSKLETRNTETETRNSHVEVCETGILCEPDDVDALAEAMRKMMTDDEYQESVRKIAVERSLYYSLENTMDRWEELLNQIVR